MSVQALTSAVSQPMLAQTAPDTSSSEGFDAALSAAQDEPADSSDASTLAGASLSSAISTIDDNPRTASSTLSAPGTLPPLVQPPTEASTNAAIATIPALGTSPAPADATATLNPATATLNPATATLLDPTATPNPATATLNPATATLNPATATLMDASATLIGAAAKPATSTTELKATSAKLSASTVRPTSSPTASPSRSTAGPAWFDVTASQGAPTSADPAASATTLGQTAETSPPPTPQQLMVRDMATGPSLTTRLASNPAVATRVATDPTIQRSTGSVGSNANVDTAALDSSPSGDSSTWRPSSDPAMHDVFRLQDMLDVDPTLGSESTTASRMAPDALIKSSDGAALGGVVENRGSTNAAPDTKAQPMVLDEAEPTPESQVKSHMPRTVRVEVDRNLTLEVTTSDDAVDVIIEGDEVALQEMSDVRPDLEQQLDSHGFNLRDFSSRHRRDQSSTPGSTAQGATEATEEIEPTEPTQIQLGHVINVVA